MNIYLEFLAANIISFVQLLDTGIIWCFKALYHKAFYLRAIKRDETGI